MSGCVEAREVSSGLLVAGKVEGDVKTLLTPLTALLVGAGFGLVVMFMLSLFGRKRRG